MKPQQNYLLSYIFNIADYYKDIKQDASFEDKVQYFIDNVIKNYNEWNIFMDDFINNDSTLSYHLSYILERELEEYREMGEDRYDDIDSFLEELEEELYDIADIFECNDLKSFNKQFIKHRKMLDYFNAIWYFNYKMKK